MKRVPESLRDRPIAILKNWSSLGLFDPIENEEELHDDFIIPPSNKRKISPFKPNDQYREPYQLASQIFENDDSEMDPYTDGECKDRIQ